MKIVKKQLSSINERKDPLFYSFKNSDHNPFHHNKKNLTESLKSFNEIKSNPLTQYNDEDNCFNQKGKGGNCHSNKPNSKSISNDSQNNAAKINQIDAKEKKNNKENDDDLIDYENDIRLEITLQKLGLEELIHVFNNFNITFNDLLFLEKEDLDEMQLHLFQKNRLLCFINEYTQNSSQYTIGEILIFFNNNTKYQALAQNKREC